MPCWGSWPAGCAAGYEAFWQEGIDDWDLIRLAQRENRLLLSSDTGIFRIGIVRDGEVAVLFVPHGLGKREQLAFVLSRLRLDCRPPRCMACGGSLQEKPLAEVHGRVPQRTLEWVTQFFECVRCGRLFWPGSHWQKIATVLQQSLPSHPTNLPPPAEERQSGQTDPCKC